MVVLYWITLAVPNLTNHWSYSIVALKTQWLKTLSLFLIFIEIVTLYFFSQGGQNYILTGVQVGYCFVGYSIGYFFGYCQVQLSQYVFKLYSMLPINIFPQTTQFTSHYIYNECLQDDCLTRTACKTGFNTFLNEGLF